MKKNVYLVLFLSLVLFFAIRPTSQTRKFVMKSPKKTSPHKEIKRLPASVPTSIPKKENKTADVLKDLKREFKGDYVKDSPLTILNKVSKNWKEKFTKNFLGNLPEDKQAKEFKIKHHKSILDIKKGTGRNLEHIIVSYIKPDGKPFSFEALVDSETGTMIQTWNQTRYEFKEPIKLNMRGREFRSQK